MADKYHIEGLPEVDQRMIKRGMCPWCVCALCPTETEDICPECGDRFTGTLTIED